MTGEIIGLLMLAGMLDRRTHHLLMPAVQPVKHPDRHGHRPWQTSEFLDAVRPTHASLYESKSGSTQLGHIIE